VRKSLSADFQRRDDRPGLAACLKAIQPGNTLVLWKLDRLVSVSEDVGSSN